MACSTDEDILHAIQHPEQRAEAFDALVNRYAPRLRGLLRRMCDGNQDRAEDYLGIALEKAYQGLCKFDKPCRSLEAWLITVTTRTALDELKKSRSKDPLQEAIPLPEELAAPDPEEDRQENEDRMTAVVAVLTRLGERNPHYRTLLEMQYLGFSSRDEISEATGIPKRQITAYLNAAKVQARKLALEYPVLAEWVSGLKDLSD